MTEQEIEREIDSLQTERTRGFGIDNDRFQERTLFLLRELLKLHHNHAFGQYGKHEMS